MLLNSSDEHIKNKRNRDSSSSMLSMEKKEEVNEVQKKTNTVIEWIRAKLKGGQNKSETNRQKLVKDFVQIKVKNINDTLVYIGDELFEHFKKNHTDLLQISSFGNYKENIISRFLEYCKKNDTSLFAPAELTDDFVCAVTDAAQDIPDEMRKININKAVNDLDIMSAQTVIPRALERYITTLVYHDTPNIENQVGKSIIMKAFSSIITNENLSGIEKTDIIETTVAQVLSNNLEKVNRGNTILFLV